MKVKFLGQCIEAKVEGINEIKLKKTGEKFVFNRPVNAFKANQEGKYYIETLGDIRIKNSNTGGIANIEFIKPNVGDKRVNLVEGSILDGQGNQQYQILGKWDEEVSVIAYETNKMKIIWSKKDVKKFENYFNFNLDTLQLNHLSQDLLLRVAPTDSRFRPDIKAFEQGMYELADEEHKRIFNKEKAKIKMFSDKGHTIEPMWFEP
mmetsp:Transcript_41648/g.37044  ORF Transcript_41648/g.37044 Transcript_41648/m.37044 type:complete len:206 (+) Transcript_41648:2037-2654(+)|eukprot:CAMPEP_0114585096 /NCGR_PEP_ID=MMETSP0125-20121206/8751_1 /TAXON_ID=485358 ORGANISM="Aristerostoma sp., Strain ATCC 50986" /NCGR_SAMPLE_ID=MMETSP0125 /ASSEMBLY_ACC=CAM_ASM_000245 /LENGTH=205 /DNA_ID=CAMNT_0001780055 /DNA_START=1977 /DNA_END=2594 /DNA_ORIENTATION=-